MCYQDTIQWFWNPSSQQAKCCLCESERFLVGARGVTKVYLKIFMNMIMNVFKGTIGFGMLCSRHRWQTHATISEDVQFLPERPDRRPPGPPPKAPQQVQSDCPVTWYCIATLEWRSRELKFKTFRTKKYILYIIHYIIYMYIYIIYIYYMYTVYMYICTQILTIPYKSLQYWNVVAFIMVLQFRMETSLSIPVAKGQAFGRNSGPFCSHPKKGKQDTMSLCML